MRYPAILRDKTVVSWALYDWANSAFATTIMAGFFPLFFRHYCNHGVAADQIPLRLGLANSAAGILVMLLAPLLATAADRRGNKKLFLLLFTLLGALSTAALALAPLGGWQQAALTYTLALTGFSAALVFYDAFLPAVSQRFSSSAVSSLGYGMGYLGGGVLFALNVGMYLKPHWFGLSSSNLAVKASFVSVGIWWLVFALPALFCLKEEHTNGPEPKTLSAAIKQLKQTLQELLHAKPLLFFLLAYWLYIDALNSVVKMAVDYGAGLGFGSGHLISALLLTQFLGFPSAIAYGAIGRKIGLKKAISAGIIIYMGVTLWAGMMQNAWHFYILAAIIALVQGGVQALSRSFYADMIPAHRSAQYFSFYNLIGKFAAILGPLLVGAATYFTSSARLGILPLFFMFLGGLLLLRKVQAPKAAES